MSAPEFTYSGAELDVFALAQNWKRYWGSQIEPYLRGEVLEVGAGMGTNTLQLQTGRVEKWCCLEPDRNLLIRLKENLGSRFSVPTEARQGTLSDLARAKLKFDSIIYIDVLEHIELDRAEIENAVSCLRTGGHLIVLAPAHQWLFTPFDHALGHFRRYNASMLKRLTPEKAHLLKTWYLDSVGLTLSLGNRLFLKEAQPSPQQILTWDRFFVPLSRLADPLLGYRFGKTVLAVWLKN